MTELVLECAGCENVECDSFTFFKGTLLCGYCFNDFISPAFEFNSIEEFLIKQRAIMKKDREKTEMKCDCDCHSKTGQGWVHCPLCDKEGEGK